MIDSSTIASVVYLEFLINLGLYIVLPIAVTMTMWKYFSVKPEFRTLILISAWIVAWSTWKLLSLSETSWLLTLCDLVGLFVQYGLILGGLLVIIDLIVILILPQPTSERKIPTRFASGVQSEISIKVRNPSAFRIQTVVHDGLPEEALCEVLPWTGKIRAHAYHEITYPLEFQERGDKEIEPSFIQYSTMLSFWSRQIRSGNQQETKVYPNYEPVLRYALLTMDSSPEQMGIVTKNRVGMSKEFHQLRDYHLGDMLSQIDWKASSKHRALISREYQEQKDQNVILAIDCGRRMRATDGGVPQFDHCLNAMLLLAYVALKQGDQVGILSFGGKESWLPPVKGVQSMTTILNHMYDYQTSNAPSDFSEAAERLLTRQRRRAMVIVLTNVRGEDSDALIEPLRRMRQKHVVMVANLREKSVMDRYEKKVQNLDDALTLSATQMYLNDRAAVLRQLNSHSIHTIDSTAQELPVALANRYIAERQNV